MKKKDLSIFLLVLVLLGHYRLQAQEPTSMTGDKMYKHPTELFIQRTNALHGGETRKNIRDMLGPSEVEFTNCSKDYACSQKIYVIRYCFPDVASCKQNVGLYFHSDELLYKLTSNVRGIPSRTFKKASANK